MSARTYYYQLAPQYWQRQCSGCAAPGSRCGQSCAAGANSPRPSASDTGKSSNPSATDALAPIVPGGAVARTSPHEVTMVATARLEFHRNGQEKDVLKR